MDVKMLIHEAFEAMKYSYAPYSGFNVGAALLTKDGRVFRGCNVENASLGATNCAERTAFFKAISEGNHDFEAICIVGGKDAINGVKPASYAAPCGICRQVMMEFCRPDEFQIILATDEDDYKVYTLRELMPLGFGPDDLT